MNASLWKVIRSLIKEDSLVTLKLRDQAIALISDSSPKNARETKKERRKAELYSLVRGDANQDLNGAVTPIEGARLES